MTGREWVAASLKKIGAVAPSETPSASEATDGLAEGNRMLGSWSNEGLLIHQITAETPLTLTVGQAAYTMGTAGSFTTRPQSIEKAVIRDAATSLDLSPMRLLTVDEYAAIPDKTVRSAYPYSLYDDGGYTQRTITLYPVPSVANKLVLFTRRALTAISTLDTSVSLPPGYDDALIYNLAIRLAPEYGKVVPDAVVMVANESLAAIKRANHRPAYLKCDPAVVGPGAFNINTGEFN